jgi:surfeit locus 1 family protein
MMAGQRGKRHTPLEIRDSSFTKMSLRPSPILRQLASLSSRPRIQSQTAPWICRQCQQSRPLLQRRSYASQPADDPSFTSIADVQPQLVRVGGRKHGWGLLVLAIIPITAFALGSWQVARLGWKTELLARFEDRLVRDPLPLPPTIDPAAIKDFDYRRVYATGKFRHDQEMLIGPRLNDGNDGYMVVTPLEREFDGYSGNTKILICRGWIPKDKKSQRARPEGLPQGEVTVQGLLREPWKKNMFTPENKPEQNAFYFPDVQQMANHTGSQPVWIEETMKPDLVESYDREAKGIPIGRPAEVNLRNNHTQYIVTWSVCCLPFYIHTKSNDRQVFFSCCDVCHVVDGREEAHLSCSSKSAPVGSMVIIYIADMPSSDQTLHECDPIPIAPD